MKIVVIPWGSDLYEADLIGLEDEPEVLRVPPCYVCGARPPHTDLFGRYFGKVLLFCVPAKTGRSMIEMFRRRLAYDRCSMCVYAYVGACPAHITNLQELYLFMLKTGALTSLSIDESIRSGITIIESA